MPRDVLLHELAERPVLLGPSVNGSRRQRLRLSYHETGEFRVSPALAAAGGVRDVPLGARQGVESDVVGRPGVEPSGRGNDS